jgi:hypothetical protein
VKNPHQGSYAQFGNGLTAYNKCNEDGNNIGDAGQLHLSKASWTKLKHLLISYIMSKGNWMRLGGSFCFIKGNWRSLLKVSISNNCMMQTGLI